MCIVNVETKNPTRVKIIMKKKNKDETSYFLISEYIINIYDVYDDKKSMIPAQKIHKQMKQNRNTRNKYTLVH